MPIDAVPVVCLRSAFLKLATLAITLFVASRLSMLPAVLIAVVSTGILGYWLR